jgi:hypothetical protein
VGAQPAAEVAAPVAATTTKAKTTKAAVAKAADGEKSPRKSTMAALLGRQAPKKSNLNRTIKVHERMPREVAQQRFFEHVNEDGSNLPKTATNAMFNKVEEFVGIVLKDFGLRFAGINFRHTSRAGRTNPNPQNTSNFTYTPAHLLVTGSLPLMDNASIPGRVEEDGTFTPGTIVDGVFVVDQAAIARVAEQAKTVEEFKAQRALTSPMARAAAAKAAAEAAAAAPVVEESEESVESVEDETDLADDDLDIEA